ncbi:MAG: GntR family transcriptional regulator [Sphaerochaeta sp.]
MDIAMMRNEGKRVMDEQEKKKEASLKDTAYQYIKEKILCGSLRPGEVINEKQLQEDLGFSRTPVREALAKLSNEELVDIMPSRCMTVSHISLSEVKMLYQARSLIEPFIAKLVAMDPDVEKLGDFKTRFQHVAQSSFADTGEDLDSEFHTYLASCTKNKYLCRMEENLLSKCRLVRVVSSRSIKERAEQSNEEHLAIINALLKQDGTEAAKAVLRHLEKTIEGYQSVLESFNLFDV